MKKVWKWIIGIVVSLLVVAALVGVVFMVSSHGFARGEFNGWVRPGFDARGPGMMPFNNGEGRGGYGLHMRGPGMMGFGFMPFGGLMLLFPLGFLTLIVLGVVWLVKAIRKPVAVPAPMSSCKNCNYPVQAEWRNCPNCGKKQ